MKRFKKALSIMLVISMLMSMCQFAFAETGTAGSDWQIMKDNSLEANYIADGVNAVVTNSIKTGADATMNASYGDKVKVWKSIKGTANENEFDITLKVQTTENVKEEELDQNAGVVLVIDMSSSMKNNKVGNKTRFEIAQAAACKFLDQLKADAGSGKRYISVVAFDAVSRSIIGWTDINSGNNLDTVKNTIKNLTTGSGTNIQAGMLAAEVELARIPNDVSKKFVVLLSDGEPYDYYSKDLTNVTLAFNPNDNNKLGENKNGSVSTLSSSKTYSGSTPKDKAKVELRKVASDTQIYSIGFAEDIPWLGESTTYHKADSENALNTVFERIKTQIALLIKAWNVIDPMGEYIEYVNDSADSNNVTVSTDAHNGTKTLNWNLQNETAVPVADEDNNDVTLYTYTMTYKVRLKTDAAGFVENKYYPTNGYTYLSYVFIDKDGQYLDEKTNKPFENQGTVKAYTIPFTVPGVKGELPEYDFTVEFFKKNAEGEFEIQSTDTLTYEDLERWTEITTDYANVKNDSGEITVPFETKYASFNLVETATRLLNAKGETVTDYWELVENGMKLQLFYVPAKTSVSVNYFVRTDTVDSTGALIKGEYAKDAASYSVSNLDATFSYSASDLSTAGLTKVTEGSDIANGKESFTAQEIILDADAAKNVINLYYKKTANDQEATVNFYHVYKDYEWQLKNGKYEEVLVSDTSDSPVSKSSQTAKVPNNFAYEYPASETASEKTFTYVSTAYAANTEKIASSSNNKITVIPTAAGTYEATLTYEHHGEKPAEIKVLVNHEYITQTETIVKDETTGEYKMEVVTTGEGVYEHSEQNDEYAALAGETVVVSEAPKDGFTSADANEAKLTHEDSKNGDVILLQYYKYVPLETVTVNTISHFRTWTAEVDTTTGAITWSFVEDFKDEASYPAGQEKLYLGQSYTVNPNPEARKGYEMDGMAAESKDVSDAVKIDQLAKTNTLEFFYDKYENIEVASVQVVHKYYKYVQTVNGVGEKLIPVCEDNEVAEDILFNEVGETETFTPVFSFGGYDDFELDPANQKTTAEYTCLGKDGAAGTVVTLIYSRVSDERVATDLTVHHNYYSRDMEIVNGVAQYPDNWTLDVDFCDPSETTTYKGSVLYKDMSVTVDPVESYNDGETTFTGYDKSAENQYLKVLGDKGTNIVELNYYKENPLDPAEVKVTHTYKLYTYSYDELTGEERCDVSYPVDPRTVEEVKYEGESYDAEEALIPGYELVSCEFNGTTDVTGDVAEGAYAISAVEDKDQVDYVYAAYEGKREEASVKVLHYYTTIDDYDGSIAAGYDKATGLDENGEAYIPEESDVYKTYAGLNFTAATDCKPLDGVDSYKVVDSDPALTIVVEQGENIIRIYYERHFCSRTKVSAVENHSYFVYDKYTDTTTEVEELNWSKETKDLWEGENFSATPDTKGDYEMQTAEDDLTIVLMSDSGLNVVYVKYLKTIDTTPEEPHTPHRPHKPEKPEEPEVPAEPEVPEEPEIIEVPEPEVPLADVPEVEEPVEIFEEEVPLADVPATGDHSIVWFILSIMAALGLAVLSIEEKKARQY